MTAAAVAALAAEAAMKQAGHAAAADKEATG